MKYRKKPVVVEAFIWTGDQDQTEDPEWMVEALKSGVAKFIDEGVEHNLYVETGHGIVLVAVGDYIIRGVKGEIYPCKLDIFEQTYEIVAQ